MGIVILVTDIILPDWSLGIYRVHSALRRKWVKAWLQYYVKNQMLFVTR